MKEQPCKLTRADGSTRGGVVLSEGAHLAVYGPLVMCRNGIHYYRHPLLAAFMSPVHVGVYSVLWSVVPGGVIEHNSQLKSVCSEMDVGRVIDLPVITPEQRVEVAIRCAMVVCNDSVWLSWAHRWLDGTDRSAAAADAAALAADAAADAAATHDFDLLSVIESVVNGEE